MHENDNRYSVSAINRDLLRKGLLLIVGLAAVILIMQIILPSRYYFGVHHQAITLYSAKIPGFIPQPVKGYANIPVGSEDIRMLAKKSFNSPEEAIAALKTFLTERIEKQAKALAEAEKKLASAYHSYLPDLKGARAIGIEGLDEQIKAIDGWMTYYAKQQAASGERLGEKH